MEELPTFSLEVQQGLGKSSTGLGETETPLLEGTHKILHSLGPSRKQYLHRNLGLGVLEDLLGRQRLTIAHCGDKDIVSGGIGEY